MNLGQALGIQQLQIWELEERKGKGPAPASPAPRPVDDTALVRQLRAELKDAQTNEMCALLTITNMKQAANEREELVTNLRTRLGQATAKLERASVRGDDAALKAVNADLEAQMRGKDQQISELRRKYEDALSSINRQAMQIRELEHRPPQIIEKPAPVDCPVCKAIKLMVLGVEPRPAQVAAIPPHVRPVTNQTSDGAVRGIAKAIRAALASAERALTCHEIAEMAGVPVHKIQTNITHLRVRGEIKRIGYPGIGVVDDPNAGYRYWSTARPLPEGVER